MFKGVTGLKETELPKDKRTEEGWWRGKTDIIPAVVRVGTFTVVNVGRKSWKLRCLRFKAHIMAADYVEAVKP